MKVKVEDFGFIRAFRRRNEPRSFPRTAALQRAAEFPRTVSLRHPVSALLLIITLIFVPVCGQVGNLSQAYAQTVGSISPSLRADAGKLTCNHIDEGTFFYALDNARSYGLNGSVTAGVVPHHLTAAPLIGGFFKSLSENGEDYDTVVLVGPNHTNEGGEVVVSLRDWDIFDGAECDTDFIESVLDIELKNGKIASNDERMAGDHALSTLVPFVEHYWPDAEVAPVLLSSALDYGDTLRFSDSLNTIIEASGKKVLLLCSIDFSHYLQPKESEKRDAQTVKAIKQAELRTVHAFTDANVDSSASLITFLNYAEFTGAEVELHDRADASHFVKVNADGTTSYLILTASAT